MLAVLYAADELRALVTGGWRRKRGEGSTHAPPPARPTEEGERPARP